MKKIVFACLSVLLVVCLAGCGSGYQKAENPYEDIDPMGYLANDVLHMSAEEAKKFDSRLKNDPYGNYVYAEIDYRGIKKRVSTFIIFTDDAVMCCSYYITFLPDVDPNKVTDFFMDLIDDISHYFGTPKKETLAWRDDINPDDIDRNDFSRDDIILAQTSRADPSEEFPPLFGAYWPNVSVEIRISAFETLIYIDFYPAPAE